MSKRTSARLIEKEEARKRQLEEAKKPRLEEKSIFENFQHPDELSLLENLTRCGNVLENIIGYLPNEDILSLTLTSKTLNLFISENPKVLQNFTMAIPQIGKHNMERYDFKDIRRYPKWELDYGIYSENLGYVMEFLTPYGPHVKSLKTYIGQERNDPKIKVIYYTSKTSLLAILSCCQNLQELQILNINLYFNEKEVLDFPNLKKLRFSGQSYTLLLLFKNCQLRSLDMDSFLRTNDMKLISDFLKSQNKLEDLKLTNCARQLFNANDMKTVSFKLKSIALVFRLPKSNENAKNVAKFLNLHKKSLVELTLENCNVMGLIQGFNNVKTLTLSGSSSSTLSAVWPTVEKLTIGSWRSYDPQKTLETFEPFFPSVKEIEIVHRDIHHDFLAQLPKVEKLEMSSGSIISNLTCSNLKVLHLTYIRGISDGALTFNGNQLKELIAEQGTNVVPFFIQFLMRADTNLDLLKLVGKIYTESRALHQIINQNRHKIKVLTITEN